MRCLPDYPGRQRSIVFQESGLTVSETSLFELIRIILL